MDKYYLRTTVQAQQFDGMPVVKDEYKIMNIGSNNFAYAHLFMCASGEFNINKGDWIIRKADGDYDVMTDSEFKAKYSSKPDNYYQAETAKALTEAERTKIDTIFSHLNKLNDKLNELHTNADFQDNHIKQNEIDIDSAFTSIEDLSKKVAKFQKDQEMVFPNPNNLQTALTEKQEHCPYCHPGSKLPSTDDFYHKTAWDGNELRFDVLNDPKVISNGNYVDFSFDPIQKILSANGDGDSCMIRIKYCPFCRRKL